MCLISLFCKHSTNSFVGDWIRDWALTVKMVVSIKLLLNFTIKKNLIVIIFMFAFSLHDTQDLKVLLISGSLEAEILFM